MTLLALPILRVLTFSFIRCRNIRGRYDSILVLGTAQYDGRPSRQFAARLRHAGDLWRQHEMQRVYTVGGNLPGDRFTEAEVGREYLIKKGVDPDLIVASPIGNDTVSSFDPIDPAEVGRVLIVTDPNHSYRAVRSARRMGFDAFGSPTPFSPAKPPSIRYFLTLSHEIGGVVVQDVSGILGQTAGDKVEEVLRSIQGWLRPSRRARHEHLRRLKS
nr:YdcF family protein [Corynebacterium deserti]